MMRRTHKKSRTGCQNCHRRHIKCDENWPVCTNCTVAEQDCSGPSQKTSGRAAATRPLPSASSGDMGVTRVTAEPIFLSNTCQASNGDEPVNVAHMELLIHYSLSICVPEMEERLNELGTKVVLKAGLDAPYLLYETLAISARHLAITNPANSNFYFRQVVELQTKAIRLFNSANLHIEESNCVPMVLFSSTLGRHMLADTLADRHDDIDHLLNSYLHYVQVHRGLSAVTFGTWPLLMETELRPLMVWGNELTMAPSHGKETSELMELVSRSSRLNTESKKACLSAIHYLQVGLDEFSKPERRANQYFMVFNWSVLGPVEYTDLLRQRQPEALLILGYYGVLLHYARDTWQIGDAGAYLIRSISFLLDSDWDQWMVWPHAVIESYGR